MADDATLAPRKPGGPGLAGAIPSETARRIFWPGGLSARLLVVTVAFVAVAELLILATALATVEERWLSDRIARADLTTVAYDVAPDQVVTKSKRDELQKIAGVLLVAAQTQGVRVSYIPPPAVFKTPYPIDLRRTNFISWFTAPLRTLASADGDTIRVIAHTTRYQGDDFLEIVALESNLKAELLGYLWRLLWLTALISIGAGALVYFSLNLFLVRPMQRITTAMERFRADPEDAAAHIEPSGRRDEIGRAETELNRMQADLRVALNSRARMAALGEAVAKINHDLRNMLTSAQIASERLAMSGDPGVAKALPRLERALERASRLTTEVLAYGKTQEPNPNPATVSLREAIAAAGEDAGLEKAGVKLVTNVKAADQITADPDHLHRILLNLLKNARQAVSGPDRRTPGTVKVTVSRENGASVVTIADDGPGVPPRALQNLFQPFAGSARPGGTGLGLAIARELAQAHGGDLTLTKTGPDGSVFELVLPGAPETARAR